MSKDVPEPYDVWIHRQTGCKAFIHSLEGDLVIFDYLVGEPYAYKKYQYYWPMQRFKNDFIYDRSIKND